MRHWEHFCWIHNLNKICRQITSLTTFLYIILKKLDSTNMNFLIYIIQTKITLLKLIFS